MANPPTKNYVEGSVRTFTEWTPGLVRAARLMADAGSMRLVGELCEDLVGDDRIQGALTARVRGLLRLPVSFETDEPDGEDRPIRDALSDDFWKMYPEDDLHSLCVWGILAGVGLGEHIWIERDGRHIPTLKVWHPRWLRFDWQTREWFVLTDGGEEVQVNPGDGKWILFTPYGKNRPWSQAAWRPLALASIVKTFAIQDWARHSEIHGTPIRVGSAPNGAKAEARRDMASELHALGRDTAIVPPPGYDVKLLEATARTWEMFPAQIEWAEKTMAITLTGQNLTSDVTGGSFAAASVHQAIRLEIIQSDEQNLSTTLREQGLRWWSEINFGTDAPWARWDTRPPEDDKVRAESWSQAAEAILKLEAAGLRVDKRQVASDLGIELLADDEAEPAGELLPFHFEFGLVTINEARSRLGLPPVDNGDDPPRRMESHQAGFLFRAMKAESVASRLGYGGSVQALRSKMAEIIGLRRDPTEEGADYRDDLASKSRDRATELLRENIAQIREAIRESETPEELEARLVKLYEGTDPTEFAELLRKVYILARLAGRHAAVNEVIES